MHMQHLWPWWLVAGVIVESNRDQCSTSVAGSCDFPTMQAGPCEFHTMSASEYTVNPRASDAWDQPILLTEASGLAEWAAPFEHLTALRGGAFDETSVAVGPGATFAIFDGAGANRLSLGEFRRRMCPEDALFDTQNSAAGRHAALPIPGIPADNPEYVARGFGRRFPLFVP